MTVIKMDKTTKKEIIDKEIKHLIEFTNKASEAFGMAPPSFDEEAIFNRAQKHLTMSEEDAAECFRFLNSSKYKDFQEQIEKVASACSVEIARQIVATRLEEDESPQTVH